MPKSKGGKELDIFKKQKDDYGGKTRWGKERMGEVRDEISADHGDSHVRGFINMKQGYIGFDYILKNIIQLL